jgi:hypothetical protein
MFAMLNAALKFRLETSTYSVNDRLEVLLRVSMGLYHVEAMQFTS